MLTENERNLGPPPPERTEKNLENGESKEHVGGVQKMVDKKCDCGNGEDCEYETGDDGEQE
jgi:hypothetical protein